MTTETFTRTLPLQQVELDSDKRTLSVAFSSDTPVSRDFGFEILDHNPSSIRLERLKEGGPVLVDHDPTQQVGVVESVSVDTDNKARALLRFGQNPRAAQEWQDIQDGIRRHISVGYRIHKIEPDKTRSDHYRALDWEPFEISLVAVPADLTVGVGRQLSIHHEETSVTSTPNPDTPPTETEKPNQTSVDDARAQEVQRIREITAIGQVFRQEKLAGECVSQGASIDQFRAKVLDTLKTPAPIDTHLDMEPKTIKQYSLLRAIKAFVDNDWKQAGLEREASLAIAERMGREPRGFFVPYDIQTRLQQVQDTSLGGDLVATDLLSGSFIDILRNRSALAGLGATMLTQLEGFVQIPKQLSSAKFNWVDEDGEAKETALTFGQIGLSPKTITGSVPITRRLLKQSSLDIEQLVRRDLAIGAALAIDSAALMGSGKNNEPKGILSYNELAKDVFIEAPSYKDVVHLETMVDTENALQGSLAYLGHAQMTGHLKTTEKANHTGQFLLAGNTVNGYRYQSSNQVPRDLLLFGDFSSLIIGMWGVLDILPDQAAKAASGGLVIRVFQDIDMAIRHTESFALLMKSDEVIDAPDE